MTGSRERSEPFIDQPLIVVNGGHKLKC